MDIIGSYAYQGKNIYSLKSVIKMQVDLGEYYDTPTKDVQGFNEKILLLLPGLKKHCCSLGYEGGFADRLVEGTYFGHVIEHIAIELQNMLGYNISYGKTRVTEKETIYNIIYRSDNEIIGIEAGKLAVDLVNSIIQSKELDFAAKLRNMKKLCAETGLGPSTAAIMEEAVKRDIPVMRIGDGSMLQLGYGKKQKRVQATLTDNSSCIAVDTACNKSLSKMLMHEYGIPVPEGRIVRTIEEAAEYSEKIGYPVVVKPNFGSHGKGVSINLKNAQEVMEAYNIAREYENTVLVEKYIKGNYFRILVINGKVVAASQRMSAHVSGDGRSTIKELIDMENNNPMRGYGHEKPLTKINIDKVVELHLKKHRLTLDYIPAEGERIPLRENDNLSTGGIAIDVTDEIHPLNAQMAELAAQIIGLDVAGVDMTVTDISKPLDEQGGAIIEINAAPGIRMHHYPAKGTPRNAAKAIVDMLCPAGKDMSIPIASVTGTNGKTTTTRMIAHIIAQKGHKVGMTTTSGIYIDGKLIKKGDNTGPVSAKAVLMDKNVEYAVLETARGGIVNKGLGYEAADVGIVTNISEDHLGIDGINTLEELAFVKALIVEAVKPGGYAVLNADDPYCLGMAERVKENIIYFSIDAENEVILQHIRKGGAAVYSNEDVIFINREGNEIPLMAINEIPATMDGVLTHNISNSLAAIAGAMGMGISLKDIRAGLSSFSSDCQTNPGRFNVFDVHGIKVVLDYGHNIDGYRAVTAALRKMKKNRLIGVIGVPGDRTDSSTLQIGQLSGDSFDRIYIKEDNDKRGREIGAVAQILEQGCKMGSISPSEIFTELIEEKALERAIAEASAGDIIVAFFEEYQPLVDVVEKMRLEIKSEMQVIA